jgi:hypothetical protein
MTHYRPEHDEALKQVREGSFVSQDTRAQAPRNQLQRYFDACGAPADHVFKPNQGLDMRVVRDKPREDWDEGEWE